MIPRFCNTLCWKLFSLIYGCLLELPQFHSLCLAPKSDFLAGTICEGPSFSSILAPNVNRQLLFVWQGFKITRQSLRRSTPNWQAISANRNPSAGRFTPNQQSLGMQLAQLGRDASAAVSSSNQIFHYLNL